MVDRYRNYQPRRPSHKPKPKNHRIFYVLAAAALLLFGGKTVLGKVESEKSSESKTTSLPKSKATIKADPITSNTWNDLNQKVSEIINQNSAVNISVAVIDISTNTKGNYGIQDNFAGASTTKVLTAAAYLHDVETGKSTLEETISGATADVQIRRMINQSNNTSWEALNATVGAERLESYAHKNGMSSYKYYGNLITSSDQALLLSKLYKKELLNDSHTKLLLSFMKNTNNEDMIPVVAPQGSTFYHKYGQLEDRLHDAAIIDYKNRPISLVVYTKGGASDGSNYASRIQLVQQLASAVITTIYAEN